MNLDAKQAALYRAVAHFNDPVTHEEYFQLYAEDAVFHGYPPGAETLEGAKQYYRQVWAENPTWALEIAGVEDLGDRLRVRFSFGPVDGLTTLRYSGDRVVERWQGR